MTFFYWRAPSCTEVMADKILTWNLRHFRQLAPG